MKESTIERSHRKIAKAAGWFVDKIMRTSMNSFPDRFYAHGGAKYRCRTCNRGRVVLIEWKAPGKPATPQQKLRHTQLRASGIEVYVVDSIAEAERILEIEIPTTEYNICKCGCGRRFGGDGEFAFESCRIGYERLLDAL
jgi:hypothetical protein